MTVLHCVLYVKFTCIAYTPIRAYVCLSIFLMFVSNSELAQVYKYTCHGTWLVDWHLFWVHESFVIYNNESSLSVSLHSMHSIDDRSYAIQSLSKSGQFTLASGSCVVVLQLGNQLSCSFVKWIHTRVHHQCIPRWKVRSKKWSYWIATHILILRYTYACSMCVNLKKSTNNR